MADPSDTPKRNPFTGLRDAHRRTPGPAITVGQPDDGPDAARPTPDGTPRTRGDR